MPAELDEVRRRIMQLEIEREGLRKEKDAASQERLARIEKELASLNEEANELNARWQTELGQLNKVSQLQERLDAARNELEQASLRADWEKAARLKYEVTQLERDLAQAEQASKERGQQGSPLVKEVVDEQDIAEVVSKWTGVPVSKMLEGEVQKLIKMEERLRDRVVGQDEALKAVANAVRDRKSVV